MIETEKYLIDRFYQEFWTFFVISILLLLSIVALTVLYFVRFRKLKTKARIGVPIVCILLIGLGVFFAMLFSRYQKDYVYLETNRPIRIEGKVIGYSKVTSVDDLTVTKSWPMILIDGTNEQISLNIVKLNIVKSEEKLQVGKSYEFLYLPNTKNAEIIKEK